VVGVGVVRSPVFHERPTSDVPVAVAVDVLGCDLDCVRVFVVGLPCIESRLAPCGRIPRRHRS